MRSEFGGDCHRRSAQSQRSKTPIMMRQNVIDWFQTTMESRKNSPDTPIIVIMQRLHENDLSGFLLGGGNGEKWEHLCISAEPEDGISFA